MATLLFFFVCASFFFNGIKTAAIDEKFESQTWLDPDKNLVCMRWTPKENEIIIQIEAKTRGYVGFGSSKTGTMNRADILMAYFDENDQPAILDMHAATQEEPNLDDSQDYKLLKNAKKNDTHLIFTFSRKWKTGDRYDLELKPDGSNFIIWALHDEQPGMESDSHSEEVEFAYHGTARGTKMVTWKK